MALLKGQGLLLLLIQHAVDCDEFVIERYDVWEGHSRPITFSDQCTGARWDIPATVANMPRSQKKELGGLPNKRGVFFL